jgi:hypothetical protein
MNVECRGGEGLCLSGLLLLTSKGIMIVIMRTRWQAALLYRRGYTRRRLPSAPISRHVAFYSSLYSHFLFYIN